MILEVYFDFILGNIKIKQSSFESSKKDFYKLAWKCGIYICINPFNFLIKVPV